MSQSLTYNPATGKWEPSNSTSEYTGTDNTQNNTSGSGTTPPTNTGSSPSNSGTQNDADKDYIEAEFNILSGELKVTPSSKSIRVRVNDTINIVGLGKYLSGLYFVSSVKRSVTADGGYTHSFRLLKNGFGEVKEYSADTQTDTRKEEVTIISSEFQVGDSVKIVGEDAVYSNAHDGVKVPEWVKKKTLTIRQISEDRTRVLLMPIYSWIYVKYIQKV